MEIETKTLTLYTRRFFSGTMLSRISGMGRDLMMAFAFGDHPSVAAFMVAFRLSNLLRRLLGEGPLQSAFIPSFEEIRLQDSAKSSHFFNRLVVLSTVVLFILTILIEVGLAFILNSFTIFPGVREILSLTAWLFPGLIFICLYGLNISLLNCYDSFFIPSFAPFICNCIWIGAAFFLKSYDPSSAMVSLSRWIVVGFLAQWFFTLPLTLRHVPFSWKELFSFHIPDEVKKLIKSFSLGAIGVGAVQINALADAIFARFADISGPVYLWYSIRLEQLALALFGIACVSTITPKLSRAIKSNDEESAKNLFSTGVKRIMILMIPCTAAVIALSFSGVNIIYGHGSFSNLAISKTSLCLIAYGIGLVPTTLIMLYSAVFYAKDDFRTPTKISILSVIINLILNAIFVFGLNMGAISTAVATTFSAFINSFILSYFLGWKFRPKMKNILLASVTAILFVFATDFFILKSSILTQNFPRKGHEQLIAFFTHLFSFILGFSFYIFTFKNSESKEITSLLKSFIKK